MKLKQALSRLLSKRELALLPSSFDVTGDIAIFNFFPKELRKKERIVAETLMKMHKNIKVVAEKCEPFSGRKRTPKIRIIAGEKRKETVHMENGVRLKLDIEKCYFSPRLSAERLRITRLVKPNESILVPFSGVAPYPCTISKNSKAKEIYGIELNKVAHKYAVENLKINKIKNVRLFCGDVKKVLPKINKKFDRIVMPLPKDSPAYLDLVLKKLKKRGIIHLYLFESENNFKHLVMQYKQRFKSVRLIKCGACAPGIFRICLDLKS